MKSVAIRSKGGRHGWHLNTCSLSFLTSTAFQPYMLLAHSVLLQNTKIPADKVSLFRKWNDSASCRLWSRSPNSDRRLMHVSHLRRILWQEVHRETTRLKALTFKLRCPRAIYCNFSTYHLEIQRQFSTSPLRVLCISRVSQPPLSFQLFPLRTTEDTFKEKGIWPHNTTDKNVSFFFYVGHFQYLFLFLLFLKL